MPVVATPITDGLLDPAADVAGTDGLQADTAAWLVAAGNVPPDHIAAVDEFVADVKVNGLRGAIDFFAPLAGADLDAARTPLWMPGGGPLTRFTNVNNAFTNADYIPGLGLVCDGATKSFVTGYNPSANGRSSADSHVGCFISDWPESIPTGSWIAFGVQASGNNHFVSAAGATFQVQTAGNGVNAAAAGGSQPVGLILGSRLPALGGTVGGAAYWRGASLGTHGTTGTLANGLMAVGALGPAGTASRAAITLGCLTGGGGMTAAWAAVYDRIVLKLMNALGRGDYVPPSNLKRHRIIFGQSLGVALSTNSARPGPRWLQSRQFEAGDSCGTPGTKNLRICRAWPSTWRGTNQTISASMCAALEAANPGRAYLLSNAAVSGTALSGLNKGTQPYYELIDQVKKGFALGCDTVSVDDIHGESNDSAADTTYGAGLGQLQADLSADIDPINGQVTAGRPILFYVKQTGAWLKWVPRETPVSAIQQLTFIKASPSTRIGTAPGYLFATGDGTHLTVAGQCFLSEYHAAAAHEVEILGLTWTPTYMLSATLGTNYVDVVFSRGNLEFSTDFVADPTNASLPSRKWGTVGGAAVDTTVAVLLGLEFCDDTTTTPSASIVGFNGQGTTLANINANFGTTFKTGDTLRVNLSGTPTGTNKCVRNAFTGVLNNFGGPTTGPRSCLRSKDQPALVRRPALGNPPLYYYSWTDAILAT